MLWVAGICRGRSPIAQVVNSSLRIESSKPNSLAAGSLQWDMSTLSESDIFSIATPFPYGVVFHSLPAAPPLSQ